MRRYVRNLVFLRVGCESIKCYNFFFFRYNFSSARLNLHTRSERAIYLRNLHSQNRFGGLCIYRLVLSLALSAQETASESSRANLHRNYVTGEIRRFSQQKI